MVLKLKQISNERVTESSYIDYLAHMLDEAFDDGLNEQLRDKEEYAMDIEVYGKSVLETFSPTVDSITEVLSSDVIKWINDGILTAEDLLSVDVLAEFSEESAKRLKTSFFECISKRKHKHTGDVCGTCPTYDLDITEDELYSMDLSEYGDNITEFIWDLIEKAKKR